VENLELFIFDFKEELVWVKLLPELEYCMTRTSVVVGRLNHLLNLAHVLLLEEYKFFWRAVVEFAKCLQC